MKAIYLCCTFMCYNIYFSEIANVFYLFLLATREIAKRGNTKEPIEGFLFSIIVV